MWLPALLWLSASFSAVASAGQLYSGHFVIKRQPTTCTAITASLANESALAPNCIVYSTAELMQAPHYVTYTVEGQPWEYELRKATLSAVGQIGNYDLAFYCPTESYYGTPPGFCNTAPGMQLAVLHVAANAMLYEMDIMLSPAEYPPVEALVVNQPPFGTAQIKFPSGVPLMGYSYLQVCKLDTSALGCNTEGHPPPTLPDPLPSNIGGGTISLEEYGLTLPSDWIADVANELLVITAGTTRYYFNSAGFYLSEGETCSVFTHKNFASEMDAFDSRFLDFVANITVTSHYGYDDFQPVRVSMWVGVAFDTAKIDPVIQYVDASTGFYRGLDFFDVVAPPALSYGSSYWYSTVTATEYGHSAMEYVAQMANLSDPCAPHFSTWLFPNGTRTCAGGLVLSDGLCRVISIEAGTLSFSPSPSPSPGPAPRTDNAWWIGLAAALGGTAAVALLAVPTYFVWAALHPPTLSLFAEGPGMPMGPFPGPGAPPVATPNMYV